MLVDETIRDIWRDVGDGRKQPMRCWFSRLGLTPLDYHCVIVFVFMMADTDVARVLLKYTENKKRKRDKQRKKQEQKRESAERRAMHTVEKEQRQRNQFCEQRLNFLLKNHSGKAT